MNSSSNADAGHLDSALLFLSNEPETLAFLLGWFLPPAAIKVCLKAGRRKLPPLYPNPARFLAEQLGSRDGSRKKSASFLLLALPNEKPCPSKWVSKKNIKLIHPSAFFSALRNKLLSEHLDDWKTAAKWIASCADIYPTANDTDEETQRQKRSEAKKKSAAAEVENKKLKKDKINLEQRLSQAQIKLAEAAEQLGREHKRRAELRDEMAQLRAEIHDKSTRAKSLKKKLTTASSSSTRETSLAEALENAQHQVSVLQKKFALTHEERDDLRGVLEDYDKFRELPKEVVASFRGRPLLAEEQRIQESLAARNGSGGNQLRILVVGGGEPQHRHKGKLMEYAHELGISTEWRMAEYQSWHKEISKLRDDMRNHFDGLIILHWNRTTFTRKCREICTQENRLDFTCHYEGFSNLRESMVKLLELLIQKETPPTK
ncbi:MAG: hypothetical protein HOM77_01030 [Planctomycetes bacterium]|mgnify:FL=1|jgi:hypothetical protein|nr:hypothetical protein [Planctomycetota bacterium]MBT5100479.1 hypothetical protein [Planctomycetota bacterium]